MQNHHLYSIDHFNSKDDPVNPLRSYSPYEPEKNRNEIIKRSAIILLIIALILVIVLVISIVLIFTIGLKTAQTNISSTETNSFTSFLYEPCMCGCPSVEPLFNNGITTATRIINGEMAQVNSWPWQMLLVVFDRNQTPVSFCGATLLTHRHVLTAAHCVHQHYPPFIYLFPAKNAFNFNISLNSGYQVNRIFIHEGYNVFLHDDIAILTIEKSLSFDLYIRPICLATPKSSVLEVNEELVAIGWGRISAKPNTTILPESLQQVKLGYVPISHPNCSEIFERVGYYHPGQMCAGRPGYNVCQGDSGGPLMRRIQIPNTKTFYWEQIGIMSGTIDCGWNTTWPDIYTNIPFYYQWIMTTIKRAI